MQNPILAKYWRVFIFIFILTIPIYLYYNTLNNIESIAQNVIIIDSLSSFILLFFINIAIWYYIRFNVFLKLTFDKIIIRYFIIGAILTAFWILISLLLFIFIIPDKKDFTLFAQNIIKLKAIYGMIIFSAMIIFYNIVIINRQNIERKEESIILETMIQQEKLNNLKSQINPHFLFNSLNSISYLIYENQDYAHEAIVKLSDYFRYSLSLSKNQFTKVADEIENIKRYFEIEEIRFPNKMKIDFKIDKECEKYKIPVLILQPLAENAVKYGVYENIDISKINIVVEDNQDYCKFEITNNFDQENTNKKGTGTGIENVRKRLSLIYHRDDLLKIDKTDNLFKISINFPKKIYDV